MTMSSSNSFALSSPALQHKLVPLHILLVLIVCCLSNPRPQVVLKPYDGVLPFLEVNLSLFADNVGEPSPKTLDGGHSIHDVLLAINIGVQHTQNVLKVVGGDQRLQAQVSISIERPKLGGRTAVCEENVTHPHRVFG